MYLLNTPLTECPTRYSIRLSAIPKVIAISVQFPRLNPCHPAYGISNTLHAYCNFLVSESGLRGPPPSDWNIKPSSRPSHSFFRISQSQVEAEINLVPALVLGLEITPSYTLRRIWIVLFSKSISGIWIARISPILAPVSEANA